MANLQRAGYREMVDFTQKVSQIALPELVAAGYKIDFARQSASHPTGDRTQQSWLGPRRPQMTPEGIANLVAVIRGAVEIERLSLLTSGVGFPDWIVIGADSLTRACSELSL